MTLTTGLGVVAYRDPAALQALLATATGFDEVLVANVDDDPAVAAVAAASGATALPVPGNPGFATAVNRLAQRGTSSRVLITNDDVLLRPETAERCRASASEDRVVVPALQNLDGRRQRSLRPIATPGRFVWEWVLLPDRGPSSWPVEKWRCPTARTRVHAATAAAFLVDRSLLLEVPFPEEYVMYWEEIDWFWSLRDRNVPVVMDPSIVVLRPDGRDERGTTKWERMGGNLVRLGRRRWGRRGAAGYFGLCCLWLARLAVTDTVAHDRRARWAARRAGLHGAWRSLRGVE